MGIFFKGHVVEGSAQWARHASLRITPRNQTYWLNRKPRAFFHQDVPGSALIPNLDSEGHYYATLGAGPGASHVRLQDSSTVNCSDYNLTNAVSFFTDRTAPGAFEPLDYRLADEDSLIEALFRLDDNYFDDLAYCAVPALFGPCVQLHPSSAGCCAQHR